MRTLDAYEEILKDNSTLVLSASSNLFRLLIDGVPAAGDAERTSEASPASETKDNKESIHQETTPDETVPTTEDDAS